MNYLWDVVKESIAQIFTILGFFIAWFTLTGTAADIVGIAIIISIVLWLLTIRLEINMEEENNMDCCGSGCCGGK